MAHGGEGTDTLQGTIMTGGVAMVGEMTMIEVVEGKMATTGSRRIGSAEVGVGSPAPLPGTGKIRWVLEKEELPVCGEENHSIS